MDEKNDSYLEYTNDGIEQKFILVTLMKSTQQFNIETFLAGDVGLKGTGGGLLVSFGVFAGGKAEIKRYIPASVYSFRGSDCQNVIYFSFDNRQISLE